MKVELYLVLTVLLPTGDGDKKQESNKGTWDNNIWQYKMRVVGSIELAKDLG